MQYVSFYNRFVLLIVLVWYILKGTGRIWVAVWGGLEPDHAAESNTSGQSGNLDTTSGLCWLPGRLGSSVASPETGIRDTCLCLFSGAVMTKYHKLGGSNNRGIWSDHRGGWKPKIKVSAVEWVLSEALRQPLFQAFLLLLVISGIPWLVDGVLQCLRIILPLYIPLSAFKSPLFIRMQSCWIRAHPNDLILIWSSVKTLSPNMVTFKGTGG